MVSPLTPATIAGSPSGETIPPAPTRCLQFEHHTVTIIGSCFARDDVIEAATAQVERRGPGSAMRLPGNYSLVIEFADFMMAIAHPFGLDQLSIGDGHDISDAASSFEVWLTGLLAGASHPELVVAPSMSRCRLVRPGYYIDSRQPQHAVRWWTPPTAQVHVDDAADKFHTVLSDAIAARCQSRRTIVADLSGGADSRAVALLAYQHAEPQNELRFVTYASASGTRNRDVERAAATARRHAPNVPHTLIEWSPNFFFAAPATVPTTDRPLETAYVAGRYATVYRSVPAEIHLSGDGGDGVLHAAPSLAIDLWAAGDYRSAWNEVRTTSKTHHANISTVIAQLARSWHRSYRQALITPVSKMSVWDQLDFGWSRGLVDAPFLTAAARTAVLQQLQRLNAVPLSPQRSVHSTCATLLQTSQTLQVHRQLARIHGVDAQYPFFDLSVVESALSSLDSRGAYHGRKALLDTTHQYLNIDSKERAPSKSATGYEADFFQGFLANHQHLVELFRASELEKRGLVTRGAMASAVKLIRMGARFSPAMFARAFGAELWLQRVTL